MKDWWNLPVSIIYDLQINKQGFQVFTVYPVTANAGMFY